MNKIMISTAGMVMLALLGGCVSSALKPSDAVTGEIQVGRQNSGVMAGVQAGIEGSLAAKGAADLSVAVDRLEDILDRHASEDGGFERAVLTTLALYYLDLGRRADFKRTVTRLRTYLRDRIRLGYETQYVLLVEQALVEGDVEPVLSMRGSSPRLARAIQDLLGQGQ